MKAKSNFIFSLIKSAVKGVVVSIILVLLLAFVLKFVQINDRVISIIDEIIKIIGILISVISLVKLSPYKILFKSAIVGGVYSLLIFLVFSSLQGGFSFSLSLVLEVGLSVVTGMILAVILNLFSKEKVLVS